MDKGARKQDYMHCQEVSASCRVCPFMFVQLDGKGFSFGDL